MERRIGILGEPVQEHFKKGVDIFSRDGRGRHRGAAVGVRVAYIDGLVEEDDVGVGVPAVRVESGVMAVDEAAWP